MPKIKIKYEVCSKSLDSDENYFENKEVAAILDNDNLKYKENNTKVIFNYKNKTLRRQNDQLEMIHDFDRLLSNVHILSIGRDIDTKIELNTYKVNNNNIEIKYKVNDIEIEYKVEVQ